MCGGGGGGSDAVDYQREQEDKRQQRITQGKAQLERIFAGLEGDSYEAINPIAGMDRGAYQQAVQEALRGNVDAYSEQRTRRVPKLHANHPNQATKEETYTVSGERLTSAGRSALAQLGLSGNQIGATSPGAYMDLYGQLKAAPGSYERIEGTGTPIWEQQQQAYMDYAQPQLEDQYGDAREDLTYALARQGQLAGSLSGERYADLNQDYDLRRQEVADQGRGYANQARADIASQKQSLLQMLSASADPGATATAARSAVSSLQSTPSFSALGPLFQNATAGLAAGLQGRQAGQLQQQTQGIIYGRDPDQGSGKVLNR